MNNMDWRIPFLRVTRCVSSISGSLDTEDPSFIERDPLFDTIPKIPVQKSGVVTKMIHNRLIRPTAHILKGLGQIPKSWKRKQLKLIVP